VLKVTFGDTFGAHYVSTLKLENLVDKLCITGNGEIVNNHCAGGGSELHLVLR